jgi:ATP-dependent DNA ligase
MNLNHFFEVLASNSSRNFKIEELGKRKDNELLKRVCFLALDPFTQFYIRKIPDYTPNPNGELEFVNALDHLNALSSREYTGNKAIEHLRRVLECVDADNAKVIERIIQKDLKCGVSEATVNKVWPGLVHEYPCMLASAFDQKLVDKVSFPAYVQLKADGMRFNAIVRQGGVEFRSRNGKEIQIADPMFALPFMHMAGFYACDMVFDGELIVVNFNGVLDRKTGNGILNKAVKGTQSTEEGEMVRAVVWDAIPFESFEQGVDKEVYKTRFAKLRNCVSDLHNTSAFGYRVDLVPHKEVSSMDEAQRMFEEYLAAGQEGIILKTKDMIWENKRSKKQIKFKGELECDLKVVDWVEGTGKNNGRMGALVLESACGTVRVGLGTGFSDADRDSITRESIGRIVAVKYNARISDKRTGVDSLFLPVFLSFREDKDYADTSKDIK